MPLREASGLIWSQVLPSSRSLKSIFSPSCQLLFLRTSQLSVFGLDNWPLAFVLASLEIFGGSRSQAERGPLWRKRRGPEALFTFQNGKPLAFLETVFSQVLIHDFTQGCIIRSILPSGMGARGVSSEHVENMRCFPVLQLRCALILREPCSGFWRIWCYNKHIHVCLREVKNSLFSFRHSYLRHFSWRF